MVVCAICGVLRACLTKHLRVQHNLTKEQYLGLYPNSLVVSAELSCRISATSVRQFTDPLQRGLARKNGISRFQDPVGREKACLAARKRWEQLGEREKTSAASRRAYEDPSLRGRVGKISAERWKDLHYRELMKGRSLAVWSNPQVRDKFGAAQRKRFLDPEELLRHSARQKICQSRPEVVARKSLAAIRQIADPKNGFGSYRSKYYDLIGPCGTVKLHGKYELKMGEDLNRLGVDWKYQVRWFEYQFEGKTHRYLPDFFLPSLNLFLEVHPYRLLDDLMFCKVLGVPIEHNILIVDEHNWGDVLEEIKLLSAEVVD